MRIIYFVVAVVGFAAMKLISCTPMQTTETRIEHPRPSYTKPKQPSYGTAKGEVTVISIQYFRVDTIPLIDTPVNHKTGKHKREVEEIIHSYEDPKLVDSLHKYLRYPEILLRSNLEGTVMLELRIDKTGKIIKAETLSADNPTFAKSATSDLYRYARFVPLIIDNRPEKARCVIVLRYTLLVR
ncbi:MAG TPA: energy transducer TonB [Candidatus Kapabacteria bacterium]|nr:energy transducer TonB [Candidatus Kapabacteria bacterium]